MQMVVKISKSNWQFTFTQLVTNRFVASSLPDPRSYNTLDVYYT